MQNDLQYLNEYTICMECGELKGTRTESQMEILA